jgi:hypothetical protein
MSIKKFQILILFCFLSFSLFANANKSNEDALKKLKELISNSTFTVKPNDVPIVEKEINTIIQTQVINSGFSQVKAELMGNNGYSKMFLNYRNGASVTIERQPIGRDVRYYVSGMDKQGQIVQKAIVVQAMTFAPSFALTK